jgi:molecular chaperone IbpA
MKSNQATVSKNSLRPTSSFRSIFEERFGGLGGNLFLLDSFFDKTPIDFFSDTTFPKYNIVETQNGMRLELALAGYKRDDLSVELDKENILSVSYTKRQTKEETEPKYYKKEIAARNFNISWNIGPNIEVGDVEFVDGLLTIDLKNKEPKEPEVKRLTIK